MTTKLRDDVRGAFDKEQAALGDVGDARRRLVQGAMAARDVPASHGLQWAAGIAAVLIAAIVIVTFALVRANSHSQVVPAGTPSPKAVVSPTPLQNQIGVPDATPLILYHDQANFDQLDGVTWDGKVDGRIGAGVTNGGVGNPQGSLYTTGADIRTRAGNVLAAYGPKDGGGVFWADDGVHFCTVARTASSAVDAPGMLQYGAPGQPARNVAQIGSFPGGGSNAGGLVIIACSPGADRAIVYQAGGQGVGVVRYWIVNLSTGAYASGVGGSWMAASHDGTYWALTDSSDQSTVYGPGGALARIPGAVFGFSWDGKLAVVAQSYGAPPSIVDWQVRTGGQAIWTSPSNRFTYAASFAEPGGSHIAVGVMDPAYPQAGGFASVDLFVVGANGIVTFERKDVTLFSQ